MNTATAELMAPSPVEALTRFAALEPALHGAAAAEQHRVERYGCMVGDIGILVPDGVLAEVVDNQRICRLPNAPEWLAGLVNIRGNLIPVITLHRLLNASLRSERGQRLLVLDKAERAFAMPVDELPHVVGELEVPTTPPPLPDAIRDFVVTAYVSSGQVWVTLNLRDLAGSLAGGGNR